MKRFLSLSILLPLISALSAGLAAQPTDRYEELTGEADEYDAIEKEWREGSYEIPGLPGPDAWVALAMDNLPAGFSLFLDLGGLAVNDKDYVTRFWIKLQSGTGSESFSYEGIRCSSDEYQIYAYGHRKRDPQVSALKTPKWQRLGLRGPGNYRRELATYFICAGSSPKNLKQVQQSVQGTYQRMNPYEEFIDL